MAVRAEFFFRPRNRLIRWIARLIGAPTCGLLRGGPQMDKFGDPYEKVLAFNAPDHMHAELEGFPKYHAEPSDLRDSIAELGRYGLKPSFTRRASGGKIRKTWKAKQG